MSANTLLSSGGADVLSDLQHAESRLATTRAQLRAQRHLLEGGASQLREAAEQRRRGDAEVQEVKNRRNKQLEQEEGVRLQAERAAEHAATKVCSLNKQQLDEVRSLTSPPHIIRRVLSIVYFMLYPEDLQVEPCDMLLGAAHARHHGSSSCFLGLPPLSDMASGGEQPFAARLDCIPWQGKLAPMLRRDGLRKRILHFQMTGAKHPLIAYPALRQCVSQNISASLLLDLNCNLGVVEALPQLSMPPAARQISRKNSSGNLQAPTSLLKRSSSAPINSKRTGAASGVSTKGASRSSSNALLSDGGGLTTEAVYFASQAVGALFSWVLSQLNLVQTLEGFDRGAAQLHHAKEEAHGVVAAAVAQSLRAVEASAEASVVCAQRDLDLLLAQEHRDLDTIANLTAKTVEKPSPIRQPCHLPNGSHGMRLEPNAQFDDLRLRLRRLNLQPSLAPRESDRSMPTREVHWLWKSDENGRWPRASDTT